MRLPALAADALFIVAALACGVAQIGILWSVFARRAPTESPGAPVTRQATEILWAVLPVLALAAVLVATWRAVRGGHAL